VKYILLFVFLFLNYLIYQVTQINIDNRIKSSLYTHMHKLQVHYETFLSTQANSADVIYEATIHSQEVRDIFEEAYKTEDEAKRAQLRGQLQALLLNKYKSIKGNGVLQYHFVFPDNVCFLRMHKPSKFGDDLTNIRQDFHKVNQTNKIIRGFSQGRTAHAFRNVYPIFNNEKYIGSMEVSFPSELLQKNLNNISEIHSHFLVDKRVFNIKTWKRDDMILKYSQSMEHENFLLTTSKEHDRLKHVSQLNERLANLREQINLKFQDNRMFSLLSDMGEEVRIISFIPIYQNVTYEVVAWLVSYEKDPFIDSTKQGSFITRVVGFLIISVLFFFIYRVLEQKKTLNRMVELYDKNVIFSTTDTKGIITHASDAFCEISGYSLDELIGKPHNIVRDKEMAPEIFHDLWTTIHNNKTWKGEVRNRKKDGSFYWVVAEVEPIFEDNKKVGYSAIRHDITDRKDVDNIQKDIIFTMGTIGENRSKETGNHVRRVAHTSKLFAKYYGLSLAEQEMIFQTSPMHDIGKIAIPDSILNKPGKLTPQEWETMETHAQKGYEMLSVSSRPLLQAAAIIAYQHHEKWDGSGYPRGLIGENIHIYGRITAIADVFDALGSDRVYKKAWKDEKIFELFREERGKHFDPKLIDIFFDNIDQFLAVRDSYK